MHRTTISQTEPKFPGSGAGYKYRGSFVYSVDSSGNEKLESVACDEGRISVTYSGSGTPLNRWRKSGKEEQVIGGNDLGVLDFGARHYDPWLARWTSQDPMAAKYTSLSPYSYCAGNPIPYPSGLTGENGDISFAQWLSGISINQYKKAPIFRIYLSKYSNYLSYGPDSIPSDFSVDSPFILPEAVIKAY